jgi:hypothetical protein
MLQTAENANVPGSQFLASQGIEKPRVLETKKRPPNPSRFTWKRVNEVTWKLTNGEVTNVPASHGQWAGHRTTTAIAFTICMLPGHWLARCGDWAAGPTTLVKAKSAAMAMAKGAVGDFRLTNPIAHLNGLTARLMERNASHEKPGETD